MNLAAVRQHIGQSYLVILDHDTYIIRLVPSVFSFTSTHLCIALSIALILILCLTCLYKASTRCVVPDATPKIIGRTNFGPSAPGLEGDALVPARV